MLWEKFLMSIIVFVIVFAPALFTLAAPVGPINTVDKGSDITTTQGLFFSFCTFMNWFFAFVLVFAVIAFLYGAVLFFLANADEQKVSRARWFMFWGVIGVAIAFLARSFVLVVANFVGASVTTLGCSG